MRLSAQPPETPRSMALSSPVIVAGQESTSPARLKRKDSKCWIEILPGVRLMLGQRLRRLPNIIPTPAVAYCLAAVTGRLFSWRAWRVHWGEPRWQSSQGFADGLASPITDPLGSKGSADVTFSYADSELTVSSFFVFFCILFFCLLLLTSVMYLGAYIIFEDIHILCLCHSGRNIVLFKK